MSSIFCRHHLVFRFNSKEEYMSEVGLAMLFDRSGGEITPKMRDLIADMELKSPAAEILIGEARDKWDALDAREDEDKVSAYYGYYGYNGARLRLYDMHMHMIATECKNLLSPNGKKS